MSQAEYAIGKYCGITLAGLKVASLVNLKKGEGEVVEHLSQKFSKRGFRFICLKESTERRMLYVYHRDGLRKMLFDEDVRNFLYQCGYRYGSVSEAIGQLKKRMSGEFPHEIGVFLGYPLCDVCGFMRDPDGCLFCGVWKVYDNEEQAKRTFEKFRRCSDCICRHMQRGKSLVQIFNVN